MSRAPQARRTARAWRSGSIDLTTARTGDLLNDEELPGHYRTFLVSVLAGELSAGQLYLGFDGKSGRTLAVSLDLVDAGAFPVVVLEEPASRVFLYHAALAGVEVEVTALAGVARPTGGGGGEVTVAQREIVEASNGDVEVPAASTSILAANAGRAAWGVRNKGDSTIHLRFAAGAATTDDWPLDPGDSYEEPLPGGAIYLGEVRAIAAAASSTVPNVAVVEKEFA